MESGTERHTRAMASALMLIVLEFNLFITENLSSVLTLLDIIL